MENYEIISNIGQGSFGVVSKIKRKSDGKILVWKEMNYGKMSEKEKQQLVAEVNILRELKHPNIVRYYDRIIDKKNAKIYIVMEYCEGGDMGTLLKNCKKENDYIAEDVIWKIFTQIIIALYECHKHKGGKILHRDLKPANIFLDSQNNIKLGDFGLSRIMSDQSIFAYTHVGTPYYMSPEQIDESKTNEKSDIWSAACLLYEIAALKPPFEAKNHLSLAVKIKAGKFDRLPIRYSEDLQKLIEAMLDINPNRRPDVDQLLRVPQIAIRNKERKLRDMNIMIKEKEDELKKKEDAIKTLEKNVLTKEDELKLLENRIMEYERYVKSLEYENNLSVNTSLSNISTYENTPRIISTQTRHFKKADFWKDRPNSYGSFEQGNLGITPLNYQYCGPKYKSQVLPDNINNNSNKFLKIDNNFRVTISGTKRLLSDITNLIEKSQQPY